jgi:hypothetical protein
VNICSHDRYCNAAEFGIKNSKHEGSEIMNLMKLPLLLMGFIIAVIGLVFYIVKGTPFLGGILALKGQDRC